MRSIVVVLAATAALTGCGSAQEEAVAAPSEASANAVPAQAGPAAPAAAYSGPTVSKADLAKQVCFLSPAEIEKALGFAVEAGKPDTSLIEQSGMAACVYDGKTNSLRLNAYWIEPGLVDAARQGMTLMAGGQKVEKLAGDPDSAYLQDQQDNGTSLHYLRQNLRVQLHATSGMVPFAEMKPRLLALRRVP